MQCVLQPRLFLAKALGLSHKPAEAFSKNAVIVFNVRCFNLISGWVSINYSVDFVDDATIFSELYELSVIDAIFWRCIKVG